MGQLLKYQLTFLSLCPVLVLAACASNIQEASSTATERVTLQVETDTPEVAETSLIDTVQNTTTPTPDDSGDILTPAATAEPPLFEDTLVSESRDLAFDADSTGNCDFPCWYGLRIGLSTGDDIQAFFDDTLAFNGTREFIPDIPPETTYIPKEYYGAGYAWNNIKDPQKEGGYSSFSVSAYYTRETSTLVGLKITTSYSRLVQALTPAKIIRQLGEPSQMYIALGGTESSDIVRVSLDIIFSEGYVFRYPEIYIPVDDNHLRLCLDEPSWNVYDTSTIFMYISEPFIGNPPKLTPLQETMIRYLGSENYTAFSTLFGLELGELSRQLNLQDDLCVIYEN